MDAKRRLARLAAKLRETAANLLSIGRMLWTVGKYVCGSGKPSDQLPYTILLQWP